MHHAIIYGIPNCDSVKKTIDWFKKNKLDFSFHDYKKAGITQSKLTGWCREVGYEILVNRKGSTWRKLLPAEQAAITSQAKAIQLMVVHTSIIKRPVIEYQGKLIIGFDEALFEKILRP
jgi:Spx/MgsR family transcriptional regulator